MSNNILIKSYVKRSWTFVDSQLKYIQLHYKPKKVSIHFKNFIKKYIIS